jgi:hypothetical protein
MEGALYLILIVGFAATWITARKWIRRAPEMCLLGFDMNKLGLPKVAERVRFSVVFGFLQEMLANSGIQTLFFGSFRYLSMLAVFCAGLMTCTIGMIDDISDWKIGHRQWQKPFPLW